MRPCEASTPLHAARHWLPSIVACVALLAMACVGSRPPERSALLVDTNPFHGRSRNQIGPMTPKLPDGPSGSPSRFCVDHVSSPIDPSEDDDRLPAFEKSIGEVLRARGFEVVGAEALNETWKRVFEEAGDLFDRHTGEKDPERYQAARRAALAALHDERGCDFMMIPEIMAVSAAWNYGIVRWDGAVYPFEKGLLPGHDSYGYVGALSLHLNIYDLEGELVYFGTGGIQPTSELIGGFGKDVFEAVAVEELLRSDERNAEAIWLATDQMTDERPNAHRGAGERE
ncbi:MAG TPA: hypothetical protein ENI85_09185 [Deltaproteobacteria bacterium]|nr:hypothetical protein [Deltaproteobacteria bacterium]